MPVVLGPAKIRTKVQPLDANRSEPGLPGLARPRIPIALGRKPNLLPFEQATFRVESSAPKRIHALVSRRKCDAELRDRICWLYSKLNTYGTIGTLRRR